MKQIAFLLLMLPCTLLGQTDSLRLDLGTQTDSTYSNSYFGLTLDIPDGFYVLSMDDIYEMAGEIAKDPRFRVRADFSQSVVLFMAKEHRVSELYNFNSNFMVSAGSRNMDYQGFADERAYIDYVLSFMEDKLPASTTTVPAREESFAGHRFVRSEIIVPLGDGDLHQIRWVKFFGDVLLDINYMYHEEEDNATLFRTVESIRIAK